jgi:hypothetical protein
MDDGKNGGSFNRGRIIMLLSFLFFWCDSNTLTDK